MKKRPSKSVSATPKTSSPFGTSAATGATENRKKHRHLGRFGYVLDHLENMTPEEFHQDLISAGVIDSEGKLTAQYTRGQKK